MTWTWPDFLASNAARVTPRAAVAAGSTMAERTDVSLDMGCDQFTIALPAWSTTSSFWPACMVTAWSFSVAATSKPRPPGDGVGLAPPPVPAEPQATASSAMAATNTNLPI